MGAKRTLQDASRTTLEKQIAAIQRFYTSHSVAHRYEVRALVRCTLEAAALHTDLFDLHEHP